MPNSLVGGNSEGEKHTECGLYCWYFHTNALVPGEDERVKAKN